MNTTQAGDRVENLAVYLSPADNCEGPLLGFNEMDPPLCGSAFMSHNGSSSQTQP